MPYSTAQNPFYTPGAGYGASQNWTQTPYVQDFLDPQIPEGVFNAFLGKRGYGGMDAMSSWAQNLYGRTLAGYKAAKRENPALQYRNYLGRQYGGDAIRDMYMSQTPRDRGENPGLTQARTRLISWG